MPENSLAEELGYYREQKAELLKSHEGKFALIKGRNLLGVFDSQDAAYAAGLQRLGNVPMLILRIQREEPRVSNPALHLGLVHASLPD